MNKERLNLFKVLINGDKADKFIELLNAIDKIDGVVAAIDPELPIESRTTFPSKFSDAEIDEALNG